MSEETTHVYGRSDDLIYVQGGELSKETPALTDEPTYLLFNNGALVKAVYDEMGTWRVTCLNQGLGYVEVETLPPGNDFVSHDYSEVLCMESPRSFEPVYKTGSVEVL